MKYKFSQVTKKSVSLLLAILMMFSMLTIGISVNAVTDGVFAAGETIYFDFTNTTATQANILNTTYNPQSDAWHSSLSSKIVPIVLKAEYNVNGGSGYGDNNYLVHMNTNSGWKDVAPKENRKIPTGSQNCLKILNDEGNYEWTTYKPNTYYYKGTDKTVNSTPWAITPLTVSEDGYYEYVKCNGQNCTTIGTNQFLIGTSSDANAYKGQYVDEGFNGTDIIDFEGTNDNANIYCNESGEYYLLVYYPNTEINKSTTNPVICASTTLPNNSATIEPSIRLSADSTRLVFDGTSASTSLTAEVENCTEHSHTITYQVTANDGVTDASKAKVEGTTFTATAEGSYKVTATTTCGENNLSENVVISVAKKYFYYFYHDNGSNIKNDMVYEKGLFRIDTNGTLLSNSRKFKISSATTCSSTDGTDNANWTVNHNSPTLEASPGATQASATITQEDQFMDLVLGGSGNNYVITYTPDYVQDERGLKGTVKVWTKTEYDAYNPQSTTPTPTKYTVTIADDISNGTVRLNPTGTTTFSEGETVTLNVVPNANFQISTLTYTPENGTAINITGTDGSYSFQMPAANVTINATFTATSTPATNYYFGVYNTDDADNPHFALMTPPTSGTNTIYTYTTTSTDWVNHNGKKFKITTANNSNSLNDDKVVNNTYTLSTSTSINASDFTYDTQWGDLVIGGSYGDEYVIEFNPTAKTVKLWAKADYTPQPTTPTRLTLSPTSAKLGVGDTVTLKATHKTDCATKAVTFVSSDPSVATVTDAGVVKAMKKGTATITATCTECGTATCTVTVSTIPFAVDNRIYAYAGGSDTNLQSDAWVCSEDATASKIDTHHDTTSAQPTLGSTSATNLRIFLPTTVSDSVLLYNSFNEAVTINGVTIPSNDYKAVTFESGKEYSFGSKKLTLYTSSADGALYLNNTGAYAGLLDDGSTVKMYDRLFSAADKDASEMASGNRGAVAYSDEKGTTISNVTVKKVKGRGNSTWRDANKKSFNVNFNENLGGKINKDFKGKKYSLLANFKDPSLSRNKILYQLAKDMGVPYVPATATVDVYMNGLYLGSYLMTQKVEVGSKEVVKNLGDTLLEDLYTDPETKTVPDTKASDIQTNGFSFLIELDSNAGAGDFWTSVTESGFEQKITIKEPEYLKDNGSQDEGPVATAAKTFVENKYKELITALNNTNITLADLDKIVDVDSLVKYLLINEIAKNYDIGVSSTYFVYNYTAKKFYASPIWDMDVSTGNCKSTIENYQSYEGNWTDNLNDGTGNNFMKRVFANPVIQSAARKLWTADYYTTLTSAINKVHKSSTDVLGSINNNYAKWNYPYGFQGGFKDNVQARTSLNKATYANGTYTVDSNATSYSNGKDNEGKDIYLAEGQILYIKDWLTSRVAWMTNKYNTYYIVGDKFATNWGNGESMSKSSGVHKYNTTLSAGDYKFKICSDGGGENDKEGSQVYRDWTATSISYSKDLKLVSTTDKITGLGVESDRNNITFTTSEQMTVYFTYNQKTNTVTLSDTTTTNNDPIVTLEGSEVANDDRVSGTAVTLTATVKPAVVDDVVVAGDYTVTLLYRGIDVVKSETVTFTESDTAETTQTATFSTALTGSNDKFTAKVEITVDDTTYSGTSTEVSYVQTGQKNNKIYFDPSFFKAWRDVFTKESTVTMTVDGTDYTMIIDPDDVHALAKGVFRVMLDDETLAKLQNSSNTITFKLDGKTGDDFTKTAPGDSNVQDGYIYTFDKDTSKNPAVDRNSWSKYNDKGYVEEYPGGCTTYQEFEKYLETQKALYDNWNKQGTDPTDNIVYFDNSVSQWYNVYIYGWGSSGITSDAVQMKKLPYADIWYYDFDTTTPTSEFLFKDRAGESFGTNYQQTVDLVGKLNGEASEKRFVRNGDGDEVYLNFEETLSVANPIFITANFYNCTIQGASADDLANKLKYRAFNTEWKEFYTVATSAVRTKAVDVYFDLHSNTAKDIQLFHTSTNSNYTFATTFTRLTPLPGSNIYHASISLPYTTANGITTAFKFTKFVVGSTEYDMSDAVQPAKNCITTGEVWYEFSDTPRQTTITDTTASSSSAVRSSAKKSSASKDRISSGANATILPSGYSMTYATVKFVKPNSWTDARMVIGNGDNSQMISKINQDNGNVYTFEIKNYNNYDGFYFGDFDTDLGYANQDYYTWANNLSSGHVTSKIQNQSSGVTYRLVSGSSGDVEIVPDTTITTIYVYKGLTINSSTAKRLYAWYTDSSSNKVEPLGNGNNTNGNLTDTVTKTIEKIGGVDYYRFDFGCSANTFNFEVNDNSTNKITRENLPAGKTYFVNSNNTVDILTTFYINKELVISKNGVERKVANIYAWIGSTNYSGDWPGSSLENSVQINGKEYYVTTVRSNIASKPSSLDSLKFILNTESSGSSQTYTMTKNVGGTYRIDDGFVYDNHTCNIIDSAPIEYSVALDNTTLSLDLYSAKSSTLTVTPKGFDVNTTGSWTSNAEGVATVDNGTVTAVGVGTATITVTYTEDEIVKSATCTVTVTDSTPADAINSFTVNGSSTETITLSGNPASATASLAIDITNPSKTVSYSIKKDSAEVTDESVANVSADGTKFTAYQPGTYVVTATINGTDITAEVTITVNQGTTTVTDHCGILGYNHITATFEATNGGTIVAANTGVTLKGGYYTDDDHLNGIPSYLTGYKTTDGDVITVIYALVTEKTGASTTFDSTTSHVNEGTGEGKYKFNGWDKNGTVFEQATTNETHPLSDGVSTTAIVNYIANWSEVPVYTYTFKYKYDDYNVENNGIEYIAKGNIADNVYYTEKSYTVKVNSTIASTDTDAVNALYLKYAPKLESDYFNYSFDGVTPTVSGNADTGFTATGKAKILGEKKYSVSAQDVVSGTVTKTEHFYQNIVVLTHKAGTGKYTVWKNENGAILGYGNTYKFRITKNNITIYYDEVDSKTATERTIVNAPTYEFYTSGDTQRVRFNFLVENFVEETENNASGENKVASVQYGVLYFFTDKDGNPLDSSIAEDKDSISKDVLESAALGASTGIMKTDFTTLAENNNNRKYIFAPTLSYTSANIDRYLRVYSYVIKKYNDGTKDAVIVSDPTSCILGSIREAIS